MFGFLFAAKRCTETTRSSRVVGMQWCGVCSGFRCAGVAETAADMLEEHRLLCALELAMSGIGASRAVLLMWHLGLYLASILEQLQFGKSVAG